MVNLNKIFFAISGGAIGLGICIIGISLFAFNGKKHYTNDKIGIEMGLKVDAVEGKIFVWICAPSALKIYTEISNVFKLESDGYKKETDITGLFPITSAIKGGGQLDFEISAIDDAEMPNLANLPQDITPMAYIHPESKFPTFMRSMMVMYGVLLRNWGKFKFGVLGIAIFFLGSGVAGLVLDIMNSKKTPVQEFKLEMEDQIANSF